MFCWHKWDFQMGWDEFVKGKGEYTYKIFICKKCGKAKIKQGGKNA